MSSIFLCHSSQDKFFVRKLAEALRNEGVRVWLDEAEIKIGGLSSRAHRPSYIGNEVFWRSPFL